MLLLFLVLCLGALSRASVWENLNASIVVMEYQPVGSGATKKEIVLENTLQYYNEAIRTYIQNDKLSMIIFPESTLRDDRNTSSEINVNTTCDSTCEEPVKSLSSLARTLQSYVVVNLVEKAKCNQSNTQSQNCQNYGYNFYNTDVIFNRNGTVIARYRKYNLFGEYDKDIPEPQAVIFTTDFDVTFGIFTCFDILFITPAQDLVTDGVDAVIFPTMWFSELPFLTAVQTQQMWAHTHNKVFFAAGANNPARGSGGSGIYNGSSGALVSGYVGEGGTKAFIYKSENGKVSVSGQAQNTPREMAHFHLKRDKSLDGYKSLLLNTSMPENNSTVCYDNLCCNFTIKISTSAQSNLSFYTYHLVAFSGVRSFDGVYNGGVEVCGLLACLNSSLTSCGQRFENYDTVQWPLTFNEIKITANFETSENRTQYPNSLLSSILPIHADETAWSVVKDNNVTQITFSTTRAQTQVLTFAIYGRNFALDSPPYSAAVLISITHLLLLSCFALIAIIY